MFRELLCLKALWNFATTKELEKKKVWKVWIWRRVPSCLSFLGRLLINSFSIFSKAFSCSRHVLSSFLIFTCFSCNARPWSEAECCWFRYSCSRSFCCLGQRQQFGQNLLNSLEKFSKCIYILPIEKLWQMKKKLTNLPILTKLNIWTNWTTWTNEKSKKLMKLTIVKNWKFLTNLTSLTN